MNYEYRYDGDSSSDRFIAENEGLNTRWLGRWMDFRESERDSREQIIILVTELHLEFEGEKLREN